MRPWMMQTFMTSLHGGWCCSTNGGSPGTTLLEGCDSDREPGVPERVGAWVAAGAADSAQAGESVGGVGEAGVLGHQAAQEGAGPGDVAGPLVERGEGVPQAEVVLSRSAHVHGTGLEEGDGAP